MNLTQYISFFHRRRTEQLSAEEEEAFQQVQDPELNQELEKLWADSRSYQAGYEPDVERGLSRLKSRIEADRAREAKTVQLRPKPRRWVGIAATLALVMAFGVYWITTSGDDTNGLVYTTTANEQIQVTLPDESVVYLNEHSYLSYQQSVGERTVALTGEAYFEIAPNPDQPFVIHANSIRTTVLGTAFNLRAYPEEPTVEVEVKEGRVRMEDPQADQNIELKPMERGVFSTENQQLSKQPSPELNAQGWRSQSMVFRNAQLSKALEEIGRYYRVEFDLLNSELEECALSTEIKSDPLPDFLQVLETIYGLEVQKTGPASYTLSGGRCH